MNLNVAEGRGSAKRKVKPVEPQSLLDFDLGEGESSDDSDFRIEDHPEESDDYSINTDDEKSMYKRNVFFKLFSSFRTYLPQPSRSAQTVSVLYIIIIIINKYLKN